MQELCAGASPPAPPANTNGCKRYALMPRPRQLLRKTMDASGTHRCLASGNACQQSWMQAACADASPPEAPANNKGTRGAGGMHARHDMDTHTRTRTHIRQTQGVRHTNFLTAKGPTGSTCPGWGPRVHVRRDSPQNAHHAHIFPPMKSVIAHTQAQLGQMAAHTQGSPTQHTN